MSAIETERKFIIKMPEAEKLLSAPSHTSSDILQIYLSSPEHITHRIRKREYPDKVEYTETKKIRIDRMSAYEDEKTISRADFELLSENLKAGTVPLKKTRHTFRYAELTFEVDIYPEWIKTAIMEVELKDVNTEIRFPEFIEILQEVTGISAYSNASMARNFPKEYL